MTHDLKTHATQTEEEKGFPPNTHKIFTEAKEPPSSEFNPATLKLGTKYHTYPVAHRLKIATLCELQRAKKSRNRLQAPRPTASPWRIAALPKDYTDLHKIGDETAHGLLLDEVKFHKVENEPKRHVPPKRAREETKVVRQTTILWQDIHSKSDSLISQHNYRTPAMSSAFKQMEHLPPRKQRLDRTMNASKGRRSNEIKLASISPTTTMLKRIEPDSVNLSLNDSTMFVDFSIPCARYGKKILPSL